MLGNFVYDTRARCPKGITGDFNAWAVEWGSRENNAQGTSLLESFAQLDVIQANEGNVCTSEASYLAERK